MSECKLCYAARLFGHRVTLVASRVQSPETVSQSFDAYHQTENPWQTLALLDQLRPDVVHVFTDYANALILPILLYAPAPVIYDPYDCAQGMIKPQYQYNFLELLAERVCFARADHICSRSLEPLFLRRRFQYRMPNVTYFPEYCWRAPEPCVPRAIQEDEELHIVYCGGVMPEDRFPAEEYGYAQYIEVGRVLAKQRIHLHIYPAPNPGNADFENFFSLYLEESKQNPFFHIYHPLPHEELVKKLPQYDAALHIMGATINDGIGRSTRAKLDYSSANKLFDYIEAGLPLIVHNGKHQRGIVRHYGQIVEVSDISRVRKALAAVIGMKKCSNEKAYIAYHAKRLGNMYAEVVKSCAL